MKTLLLKVTYTNGKGRNGKGEFWCESDLKNSSVTQKETETIHQTVARAIKEADGGEIIYNGRPLSNMYCLDRKNSEPKIIGYIYRVKHLIVDRSNNFTGDAYFDAWVEIKQVQEVELKPVKE